MAERAVHQCGKPGGRFARVAEHGGLVAGAAIDHRLYFVSGVFPDAGKRNADLIENRELRDIDVALRDFVERYAGYKFCQSLSEFHVASP
jgi:hypothetical protein